MQTISTIGVVGAGTMGNGIAHVVARSGHRTILCDVADGFLSRAMKTIEKNLQREVEKERLSADAKQAILARIETSTDRRALQDADFVVEAVTEDVEVKLGLFSELSEIIRDGVILATNTSSISVTRIAAATTRPDRVIGMHFMNPVPVMKLVEVIRGAQTSDETTKTVFTLASMIEKTPIEVRDFPGFISNRVLMPMINEAIFALGEGVATAEAIDGVMKLGMNHPMGPLTLADFIGLDVCLAIMNVIYEGFNDSKYRPAPLLKQYVAAGWLGRKTARGFYRYES